MPERVCRPLLDAFVIIGKKMHRLGEQDPSQEGSKFKPCVHRVALPYDTHRNSLLYFQDIPS